jgi:hypothetical protein
VSDRRSVLPHPQHGPKVTRIVRPNHAVHHAIVR